jgi:hypothetical protein
MERLAGFLGLSVVSGVNLYLTVLVAGLGHRLGWFPGLPPELAVLGHPLVLAVAGLLFVLEFLADKVPFVTPIWDALHTFIRPLGGALLALGAVGQAPPLVQVLALLAGGSIALGTHGTKMGARLLLHTAPDPASHGAISLAEDLGVVALVVLAYRHPYLAIPVLLALLVGLAWALPKVLRALRFVLASIKGRIAALFGPGRRTRIPHGVEAALIDKDSAGSDLVILVFALRANGAARFKKGFLARFPGGWAFLYRRLFRNRWLDLEGSGSAPLRIDPGWLWDRVVFRAEGKAQVFLVSKEWSTFLTEVPR